MRDFITWLENRSFEQLCDKANGKPYEKGFPPPTHYNLGDYASLVTNGSPIANVANGANAELTPLTWEDQARYAYDDVADAYQKIHKGQSPTRLGDPLDDEGMRRYMGLVK